MSPPPSARGAGRRDPEPSEPLGSGPRVKTCSLSCLSWLHPLKSWSLRQTRGGSEREVDDFLCRIPEQLGCGLPVRLISYRTIIPRRQVQRRLDRCSHLACGVPISGGSCWRRPTG